MRLDAPIESEPAIQAGCFWSVPLAYWVLGCWRAEPALARHATVAGLVRRAAAGRARWLPKRLAA